MNWIKAPNIQTPHGFSIRSGGVSPVPYHSMNLGGSADDPANIRNNREIALASLGFRPDQLATVKQIHSNTVCIAQAGVQTGDALVTDKMGLALAVNAADCYPLLLSDPVNRVIGAAHAGWKGTFGRIAAHTVEAMIQLGAKKKNIQVAIGPGICKASYEVSPDLIERFASEGFPKNCYEGRMLDLLACNRFVLESSGIPEKNIWAVNRCSTEPDFFSHRRDKGVTGRMWGLIGMK